MVNVIIFAALLFAAIIFLIAVIINVVSLAVCQIRRTDNSPTISRIKRNAAIWGIACVVVGGFVLFTQLTAHTPAIRDANGKTVGGSIAELRPVTLNGRKEWISIRGSNQDNPVLLFLAGGPGGTQMAAVRHDLSELEKYFVVVNWDQAGSGKSFGAIKTKNITVDTYIEDGYELTKYLCREFGQKKIYLLGESWGSALGIFMVDKAPEMYHAFIGTGQMISFLDTEIMNYNQALEIARERGDSKKIAELGKNGSPPYYGDGVAMKVMAYNSYLGDYMAKNPAIHNSGYNTFRDIFSDEYGMLDKINYLYGLYATFDEFYPKIYDIDLREKYVALDVPVYFFLGRHDINAPAALVEEYLEVLEAPRKEIVWFEHSGHSPWINEGPAFVREFLTVFAST